MTIFHSVGDVVGWLVEKYRTERSETRGRHTEEVECEGEKILTCIPRYASSTYTRSSSSTLTSSVPR